jgi:CRP-like cAMP-binding protein/CheY-like chemotaxis protein
MATILIIEDEEDIRLNLTEILSLAKYDVIAASDGKEGIGKAQKEFPDLILCDVMIPYIDGFGVLHIVRKNPDTKDIPFIFLTSKSEMSSIRNAMSLGANDYITKPFESGDLLNTIKKNLNNKVSREKTGTEQKSIKEPVPETGDSLQTLIEKGVLVEYKKGQVIYAEGSVQRFLYYIIKGRVRSYKNHEDGKELVMGLYSANDFIGYAPLFDGLNNIETAEATEDCEIVRIPRKELESLINRQPEVMKQFARLMTHDLAEKQTQLLGAAYDTLRKKVAHALITLKEKYHNNKEGKFTIKLSRGELANIAGTATESLIRTLTKFRQEKLIEIQKGGSITIVNEKGLKNLLR